MFGGSAMMRLFLVLSAVVGIVLSSCVPTQSIEGAKNQSTNDVGIERTGEDQDQKSGGEKTPAERKPDFTFTTEELNTELQKANFPTFAKKCAGKILQVTG